MVKKTLYFLMLLGLFWSCKSDLKVYRIEGKQIQITDSLASDSEIEAFIKPYREHVDSTLDSVLAYSVDTYSKYDGELNTAIGNLMADAIYKESNKVFKIRTGKDIDFALLNHGGIRAIISKGNITRRTAYEIMPFENAIVVVQLKAAQVKELIAYLAKARRAHPISKLKLTIDKDLKVVEALINGVPVDDSKDYYVLTNDYLLNGGDHMNFFKTNDTVYVLNYKIRNALIDYLKETDTVNPVIDDRFTQLKD